MPVSRLWRKYNRSTSRVRSHVRAMFLSQCKTMKLLPLLIVLVLVGCSGSPKFYTARNFYFDDNTPITDRIFESREEKEELVRDIRAIKQELTGVDTGCKFEVAEEYIQGFCGYVTSTGSRLEICKYEKVETVCRGDTKEVDIYSPSPQ